MLLASPPVYGGGPGFVVTTQPVTAIAPDGSASFIIQFSTDSSDSMKQAPFTIDTNDSANAIFGFSVAGLAKSS